MTTLENAIKIRMMKHMAQVLMTLSVANRLHLKKMIMRTTV
jgi:hypothetical protein